MHITQAEYNDFVSKGLLAPLEKKPGKKSPYKSKTEQQYAWDLEQLKERGVIEWWAYEPVTLVIVDADGTRCRYCPDFLIVNHDRDAGLMMEFVEVKGFLREAARIRFLAAKEKYPFWRFRMIRKSKGGWETVL